ncbi:hypothetical protein LOZ65_006818 [Ophidiomyces ophidiicola]|nr:hypothetical protein LOZ65_006818 [Ophidiomyces ophidiicola]
MSSGYRLGGDRERGGFRGDRGGGGRGGRGASRGFRGDRGGGEGRGYGGGGRGGGYGVPGGQQAIQVFSNPQDQDPKVAKVEDALHPTTKNTFNLGSPKLTEGFPIRPGYGTKGAKVELTANYVELLPPTNMILYRYDVQISPDAAGRKRSRVMQLLLQSTELAPHQGSLATDFRSTLVSKTKFSRDENIIEVHYRSEGEDEPAATATAYKVRVLYTKSLSIGELTNYLNSTDLGQSFVAKQELTQALNIFLNHYAKSADNLATIGSAKSFSLHENAARGDLGAGLEVIRGFFSSVRIATCRILVNINVSYGAFYHAGPLPALMSSYGVRNAIALEKFLKLVRIQTTHMPEKRNRANEVIPRVKTIFGLARIDDGLGMAHPPRVRQHGAGAKDVEFWLDGKASPPRAPKAEAKEGAKEKGKGKARPESPAASDPGRYITDLNAAYGRFLQHPQLPLINYGSRENPMYLPAEVCVVLSGQPSKSKLGSTQTQQMIRYAVRKPWENAASIVGDGVQAAGLDENSNVLLRSFGLKVTAGLIKVPGRILGCPKVVYKGNKTVDPRFGSWNMSNVKFNTGASLAKWSYLMISLPGACDSFSQQSLGAVMNEFHQTLGKIGVNAAPPLAGQRLQLQHPDDPAIGSILQRAAAALDLLFIILPEANIPLYKRIKTLADKDHGIHTICSVGSKLAKERGRDQYMANIALKFNLKLGGINQIVENKNLGIVDQNKTMVVGIDVTHPSPGSSSNAPSVSAMVASIDKFLGQWPATLRKQRARQENVDDLTEMLKSRLSLWKTKGKHTALPENILIYRDGVSESQYDMVLSQELPQLHRACEQVYPTADTKKGLPRFTIIICGKRHKTRFYPTTVQDCDRSGNTKPGTVVDRGVTEARNWDFFLQAHAALQGTARPCHYYIVHDEIFRQIYAKSIPFPFQNIADIVEDLTHNMCYLFGRATKAVSLCTPAYYADLACERARCYLASLFDTPSPSATPSVMGTSAAGGAAQPSTDDVQIHLKLKDTIVKHIAEQYTPERTVSLPFQADEARRSVEEDPELQIAIGVRQKMKDLLVKTDDQSLQLAVSDLDRDIANIRQRLPYRLRNATRREFSRKQAVVDIARQLSETPAHSKPAQRPSGKEACIPQAQMHLLQCLMSLPTSDSLDEEWQRHNKATEAVRQYCGFLEGGPLRGRPPPQAPSNGACSPDLETKTEQGLPTSVSAWEEKYLAVEKHIQLARKPKACFQCRKQYSRYADVLRHFRSTHLRDRRCNFCGNGEIFQDQMALQLHAFKIHRLET